MQDLEFSEENNEFDEEGFLKEVFPEQGVKSSRDSKIESPNVSLFSNNQLMCVYLVTDTHT